MNDTECESHSGDEPFDVGGVVQGVSYQVTVGADGRKTNLLWCPYKDCTKVAEYYSPDFLLPKSKHNTGTIPRLFRQYGEAAVDALLEHIRRDHVGHEDSCPRKTDENDYCDCRPL